ncbi:MAG: hypothetical protein RLQ12_11695, partial [Cyclobacteriaceae bacterium]
ELPHIYEVRAGLSEQDVILLEGLRKVKDGDHIQTELVAPEVACWNFSYTLNNFFFILNI